MSDDPNSAPSAPASPAPWWRSVRVQRGGVLIAAVLAVYGIVYQDVVSRAREAYEMGETYLAWHADPAKKSEALAAWFQEEKRELERRLKAGSIDDRTFRERMDTLQFDYDFRLGESDLKYAYHWFKDAYQLFSPPESRWVARAREKAPAVLEMWKQELRDKNIPFEDTMFE